MNLKQVHKIDTITATPLGGNFKDIHHKFDSELKSLLSLKFLFFDGVATLNYPL